MKYRRLKILVACEFSGQLSNCLDLLGHDVTSCDLLPSKFRNHYQGDVFDIINDGYDMMFAFPPCTYLSYAQGSRVNAIEFEQHRNEAIDFAKRLYYSSIPHVVVENPRGLLMHHLPVTCRVNPYDFGSYFSKRTYLFCKDVPGLIPTFCRPAQVESLCYKKRGTNRSILDPYLAQAMAMQQSTFLT